MKIETPMMRQYRSVKREHPDSILLFRMGDFYEMFEEDAITASRLLGLTLTTRDKGKVEQTPMAGMPWHASEGYIARLIRAGHKVAVCDQVEDPRKAKGLVKREVTEILTPGTVLSEGLLARDRDSYLAAVFPDGERLGLAALSLASGEFWASDVPAAALGDELSLLGASEILLPDGIRGEEEALLAGLAPRPPITWFEGWRWSDGQTLQALTDQFETAGLDGFGVGHLGPSLRAAGAILLYLRGIGRTHLEHVTRLRERRRGSHVVLDEITRHNLEIVEPAGDGGAETTLAGSIDRTRTSMGARLLRRWLLEPLHAVGEVRARHQAVRELLEAAGARGRLRAALSEVRDLERSSARLVCEKAGPRELAEMRAGIASASEALEALATARSPLLAGLRDGWDPCLDVAAAIEAAILPEPSANARDGGVLRDGFDAELDGLRATLRDGRAWVVAYQDRERARSGVTTLKIGYNRVFGYYIEVTRPNRDRVPADFHRKQTLANAERFTTEELRQFEEKALDAEERITTLEESLFTAFRRDLARHAARVSALAASLAQVDVLAAFAEIAFERAYVEPIVDESRVIEIRAGRHPVLEGLLQAGEFVANDLVLDPESSQIHLITGPNMAGKSTFLRQNALIVVLAQAGAFVPAASARIGAVDRVFTRIGARDDLARGQSTFLVEMIETARILNGATGRSLVLLDEVGRGTSTFDGLSIAWAVVEHLHDAKECDARTLFATHYHELTDLSLTLPRVRNFHVEVKEWGKEIVFLRRIVPGGTDRSYGIHVASLAGLPRSVVARARQVLANLEAGELGAEGLPRIAGGRRATAPVQLPLLVAGSAPKSAALARLRALDLDRMTPLEAHALLAEIRRLAEEEAG